MLTSLLPIPLIAVSLSVPPKELPVEEILWGSSPESLVQKIPDTLESLTPEEIHSHSNGFGEAKYKFKTRLFKSTGITYVLFGGKKSNQLISLSWKSDKVDNCKDIKKNLIETIGQPTEIDGPLGSIYWVGVIPNMDLTFLDISPYCSLKFRPEDPFVFDPIAWD